MLSLCFLQRPSNNRTEKETSMSIKFSNEFLKAHSEMYLEISLKIPSCGASLKKTFTTTISKAPTKVKFRHSR